jgi:putative membrane protein
MDDEGLLGKERHPNMFVRLLVALIAILAVALVVIVIAILFLKPFGYGMNGMMGSGAIFMIVPFLIIIIIIIIAIVSLTGSYHYPDQYPPQTITPLQVLELRYSRGEISREQYQQMRSDLESRDARKGM